MESSKALGPERRVKAIRHCGDEYLTTENGRTIPFCGCNLRFKTDSIRLGSAGRPVLVPAGMQGERAPVVFSSPAEISRFVEQRC